MSTNPPTTTQFSKQESRLVRRVARLITLFLWALCLIGLMSCRTQTGTPDPLMEVEVPSARDPLEEARLLAYKWHTDAELKQIKVTLVGPSQNHPSEVVFTFESPQDNKTKYYVSCYNYHCSGMGMHVSTTTGWRAVNLEEGMLDSEAVAAIALANGGSRYVNNERAVMHLRFRVGYGSLAGKPAWLGYFFAPGTGSPLYLVIDPYSGEVVDVD